jgi:hypothetical protein
MIEDVKRLLDDYEDGACTLMVLYNSLLSLSNAHPISDVIDSLPPQWREDFLAWARETFDNDIPADQFIVINGGVATDDDIRPIRLLREWFKI